EPPARLDPRAMRLGIELRDAMHVLRAVEHHGDVAALAGEAGSTTARKHRRAEAVTDTDRLDDVVSIAGEHDTDRHLPVVGRIRAVHRATTGVEPDFAAHRTTKCSLERDQVAHE